MPFFFGIDVGTVISNSIIRIRYNLSPKIISPLNFDDALNPSNYILRFEGSETPSGNLVSGVIPTFGDIQAVDITFTSPIPNLPPFPDNQWGLKIINVQDVNSNLDVPGGLYISPSIFLFSFPSALSLLSIVQNGIACLRLTYSVPPVQLDVLGSTDALNPDNYKIEGPRPNLVSSVVSVKGDSSSVDVYITEPLIDGDWSLKVVNVEAA